MRTKVLLGAAVMAASLASSTAQNVYSMNVVGYVNVTLAKGKFTCVGNPLDATMGGTLAAGLNNITNLFAAGNLSGTLSAGSYVSSFNSAKANYYPAITYLVTKKWSPADGYAAPPGVGFLFYNNGAADVTVTYTGQVEQGAYTAATMAKGSLNMLGSPVPIGGDLTNATTALNLTPTTGDYVETYNASAGKWSSPSTWLITKKWSPTTTIDPGQGFLYYNNATTTKTWISNFTVQ